LCLILKIEIENLNRELAAAGAPNNYQHLCQKLTPLEALVNGPFSAKPYVNILVKYLSRVAVKNKDMIIRALSEKGLYTATKPLLDLFDDPQMTELQLWTVGNALHVIDDTSSYEKIIHLTKRSHLGNA